jgi:hypothetical protein
MVSIDSNTMVIEIRSKKDSRGKREMENLKIPFDPPLVDPKEARVRLIDMMWESIHALGMVSSFDLLWMTPDTSKIVALSGQKLPV